MLNEVAKQQLKKAGWYEGRKIDITEQVKFLESLGYEVFDAAKKFMEEYGELDIRDRFVGYKDSTIVEAHNSTCIKDLFVHVPNKEIKKYDLDEEVGQKTIPVFILHDEICYFISEDGKFYTHSGLASENSDEFLNTMYGEIKYFIHTWYEISEGKPRRKNNSSNYCGPKYL